MHAQLFKLLNPSSKFITGSRERSHTESFVIPTGVRCGGQSGGNCGFPGKNARCFPFEWLRVNVTKLRHLGKWNLAIMELEICVDSMESAIASEKGGAQRVELCSDLLEGGITPSAGLIQAVRKRVGIDVFVMVRPRGADFFYSSDEMDVMKHDTLQAKNLGADGVVLGMLHPDGRVDTRRIRELVELAHPMQVTFHRAFDMSANLEESLAQLIEAGVHRILTSGGMPNITQGAQCISSLIQAADGKIRIMAGGGIRQENLHRIALTTGATEFHCSLRKKIETPVTFRKQTIKLGEAAHDEFARFVVLEENVRGLRTALDKMEAGVAKNVHEQ